MRHPVVLKFPADRSLVQLGKYGSFPSWELIGLHYDITYEIAKHPEGTIKPPERAVTALEDPTAPAPSAAFGQKLGKKAAKKSKKNNKKEEGEQGQASWVEGGDEKFRSNPAWQNYLRPLKRRPVVEAVLGESRYGIEGVRGEKADNQMIYRRQTSLSTMTTRRWICCHTRKSQS